MSYTTLISSEELLPRLDDPSWALIDCRFSLADGERGRQDYLQAHIPGAIYAHLDEDLSDPVVKGKTGRHPLPAVQKAVQKFSEWGIDADVQIVAYDDAGGAMAAARLWWMLHWMGHPAVALLDGGWEHWRSTDLPVQGGEEKRTPRHFIPRVRPEMVVDAGEVAAIARDPIYRVLDVRSAQRFRGENETIDPVPGHIPGAISAPYTDNLDKNGKFLSPEALQNRFKVLLGEAPPDHAVFYCGSGVTAAQGVLAFTHAGLGKARLYPGSWSEWITDPRRPVETGSV